MKQRFLRVDIYKNNGQDWSNKGISSKYNEIYLLCDKGNFSFEDDELPENACKVVKRQLWGSEIYYHVEPIAKPKGVGWMAGGCVVYSCDSRFSDMANGYPLCLHDRCESQEQYDMLSR